MLRASAACEAAGYPTSSLTCEGFIRQAAATSIGLGMPNIPVALVPGHIGNKNAEDLKLFPSAAVYDALRTQPAAQARSTYTRYITIVNADSPMHTGLLVGHRAHVCSLRG